MIVIALISEFELPSLEIACVALSARVKRSKSRQILLKGSHSWKARAGLHRRLQRRLRRPGHDTLMRHAWMIDHLLAAAFLLVIFMVLY